MAKIRKIAISAICAIFALSLSLPSFCADVAIDNYGNYFCIWNAYQVSYDQGFGWDNLTISNWADASNTKTFVTVGFSFPMLPNLAYQCDFSISQNNDTRIAWDLSNAVGAYTLQDPLYTEDPDVIANAVLNPDHLLATSVVFTSGAHMASKVAYFRATLMSDKTLSYDYTKTVTFYVSAQSWNSDERSYQMNLNGVTIYYDPSAIGAVAVDQMQQNAEEIRQLGIAVNTVNTKIDELSTQVTNDINGVKSQLTTESTAIKNQVKAMQEEVSSSIDEASNKAHQDAENTQNSINEASNKAHEDSEKTQKAIKDQPNNEYNYITDKDKELDGDADDVQNQVDVSSFTDGLFDILKKFWSFFSSTDTQTSFYVKPFTVNLPSIGNLTFWDGGQFDFSHWINNDYWMYRLVLVFKILSGIFMALWAVRFVLDVIDYLLGNSKKSMSQIIFGYNPFSRS